MEKKEFNKKVAAMRHMVPYYSNGRKVRVVSEYTDKGRGLIATHNHIEGYDIHDVYASPSSAKVAIFKECKEMCSNARHGRDFRINSHSCHNFTVSFMSDDGLTVLTRDTEYLVIFNN